MEFSKHLISGLKSYLTIIVKILILEEGMNFGIQLYRLHYTQEPAHGKRPTGRHTTEIFFQPSSGMN